jgi:hypothetical protein
MRQSGVLSKVLPESEKWGIDSIGPLIATEAALDWEPDSMLRLMAMVPPDAERMRGLSARLKMSRAETDRLVKWAAAPVVAPTLAITALDRLLYRHGADPLSTGSGCRWSRRAAAPRPIRQHSPKRPVTAVTWRARSGGNGRCFRLPAPI